MNFPNVLHQNIKKNKKMSKRNAENFTNKGDMNDIELSRHEDKSEFIRLAMKLLELKNITDTNEIKIHLKSLLKEPYDQQPKDT